MKQFAIRNSLNQIKCKFIKIEFRLCNYFFKGNEYINKIGIQH